MEICRLLVVLMMCRWHFGDTLFFARAKRLRHALTAFRATLPPPTFHFLIFQDNARLTFDYASPVDNVDFGTRQRQIKYVTRMFFCI